MTKTPARYTVVVEDDMVRIELPRWEALALAQLLAQTIDDYVTGVHHGERMRGIVTHIVRATRPVEPYPRHDRLRGERPPSTFRSPIDVDHVLTGGAPYPALCYLDVLEAYPQLEAKGLSAREISERLYVSERTIFRWRETAAEKRKQEGEST